MTASSSRTLFVCVIGVALLGVSGIALGQTSTAQSAMFNNTAAGTFLITGSQVWTYNSAYAASTYFSNAWDGNAPTGPAVNCTGASANTGRGCNPAFQPPTPATPAAPDPEANKLTPHVNNQSCNFWNGAPLTLDPGPDTTYTQKATVTVTGLPPTTGSAGNWKFEWTYTFNVTLSQGVGPFAAGTAWDLQSSSSTNAEVTVTGFFAGESTQKKPAANPGNPWTFKTSFTMTADDGTSRLVNPVAQILDSSATAICTLTINTSVPPLPTSNYDYTQNAGNNGPVGQLVDGGTVLEIENGSVCSPNGDCDNFAGNNATLGQRADVLSTTPASCSVGTAGSYTLSVTGTLKGVSGTRSLPVAVSSDLCISAGTCQVCP